MVRTHSCIVEGCFNATKPGVRFFEFPKDPERRKVWHMFVGEDKKLVKGSRVCSVHFPPEAFRDPISLTKTAVPSLPPLTPSYLKKTTRPHLPLQPPKNTDVTSLPPQPPKNSAVTSPPQTTFYLKKTAVIPLPPPPPSLQNSAGPPLSLQLSFYLQNSAGPCLLPQPSSPVTVHVEDENTEEVQWTEKSRASLPAECSPGSGDDLEASEDLKQMLCRICGLRSEDLSSIFCGRETEEDNICLEKKIKLYLPIELNADDGLPLNICSKCCDLVESWHELHVSCVAADSVLRQMFDINKNQVLVRAGTGVTKVEKEVISVNKHFPAAFEGEADHFEEKSTLEKIGGQSVDEQRIVDPFNESRKQIGNNQLEENSTIGKCSLSSNQIVTDRDAMKILPSVGSHYPYTCKHCSERFESVHEGFQHRRLCARVPSICDICGKSIQERRFLKVHCKKQHFFAPVLCEKCGKQLNSKSTVLQHKKKCLGNVRKQKYFCEPCCKVFSIEKCFRIHQEQHKKAEMTSNLRNFSLEAFSANNGEKGFICPVCGGHFQDKLSLVEHMNAVIRKNCLQCGKPLKNEKEVLRHKCRKWTCCFCCAEFTGVKALRQHKLIHKSGEPFVCKQCGSKFTSRLPFYYHSRSHRPSLFLQCEKCGKQFKQSAEYKDHMRKHEGIKYECKHCDSSYFSRSSLRKHMRKYHPGFK